MLWTGKGVASGWAGLSWDKAWMMLSGVGELFPDHGRLHRSRDRPAAGVSAVGIRAAAGRDLRRRRRGAVAAPRPTARLRAIAIVFLGTLGAGEVFNFYSQPQDPQMQINVMPWLTVAWGLLAAHLLATRRRPRTLVVLAILSLAPLIWNVRQLARWRGGDHGGVGRARGDREALPARLDGLSSTGASSRSPSGSTRCGAGRGTGTAPSRRRPRHRPSRSSSGSPSTPAPSAIPTGRPSSTPQSIKRDIDQALDRGYQVAVSDVWSWSVDELAGQLGGLAAANRAPAIAQDAARQLRGASGLQRSHRRHLLRTATALTLTPSSGSVPEVAARSSTHAAPPAPAPAGRSP